MNGTLTVAAHENPFDKIALDETSFSRRWSGLVLGGLTLAAATWALQVTPPSRAEDVVDGSSTVSPTVARVVAWNVSPATLPLVRDAGLNDRSALALDAMSRVRGLLGLSEERAASLVSIARGSVRNWRTGDSTPYPATVRRLFEIDGVLTAADRTLGPGLQLWLQAPGPDGTPRIETIEREDGPASLSREISELVFKNRGPSLLPTGADFDDEDPTDQHRQLSTVEGVFAGLALPRGARS